MIALLDTVILDAGPCLFPHKLLKFKCKGGGWGPLNCHLSLWSAAYRHLLSPSPESGTQVFGQGIMWGRTWIPAQPLLPAKHHWPWSHLQLSEFPGCLTLSMSSNLSNLLVLPCKMLSPVTCMDWMIIPVQNTIEVINYILLPGYIIFSWWH